MKRRAGWLVGLGLVVLAGCPRNGEQAPTVAPVDAPPPEASPAVDADAVEAFGQALCKGQVEDAEAQLDPDSAPSSLQERWDEYTATWGQCRTLAGVVPVGTNQRDLFFDFAGAMVPLHVNVSDAGRPTKARWMAWTPPEGFDRTGIRERLVQIPHAEHPLGATVTEPEAPVAWVVLVHGSGPNDRDGTIASNRVLRDLAWGLAARGIASLRYDKRSYAYPLVLSELPEGAGVRAVVIDDAVQAVAVAHEQAGGRPVFVAGHSLGGHLLPWIGTESPQAAGLVVLAGNVSRMQDEIPRQIEYIANLDGSLSLSEKANIALVEKMTASIDDIDASSPPAELTLGAPNRFWAELNAYDPIATMKGVGRPVLFVQGERDYQVRPEELDLWREGIGDAVDASYEVLPLNHLLMVGGEGPSGPAEYQVFGHVDERVPEAMAKWIRAHAG